MAFCTRCGASMSDSTTVCPNCGQVRAASASAPPPPGGGAYGIVPPPAPAASSSSGSGGFLSALFDFSFTTFVTTKLIKVLYALCIIVAACYALFFILAGFARSGLFGVLALVGSVILFFAIVIYSRVCMEVIIVIFRGAEHLSELVRQGRRT
jgi:Domain of unknown function (DUF4282)/zinc-ribbon domain